MQRGATSEGLGVDAPSYSHMSTHSGELWRTLSIHRKGEGPLAMDGHPTLFTVSEVEALSSLSADHSEAKSLNCNVRLVPLEELTGHRGGYKGRPGVFCGKVFPKNANMIVHMRTDTDKKPYRCDQCTKPYRQKGHLTVHMRTHSDEKPYKCDQCTTWFSHSSTLKLHMRTHTGEKPCVCLQCNASYRDPSSLRVHMLKHAANGVL